MKLYTKPALAGNAEGLPKFFGLPLLDWSDLDKPNGTKAPCISDLTAGGRVVFTRTRRPAATCNLIAALADIGQEFDHAR
ncbi:MAG: hypothetical protein ABS76_14415 [Pelagibacterium sp. SCN 64-44]|nr:MAG: hypothetical protein ABS76_14415 [Pelagibacterium sp. SCN 64-44]